MPAIMEVKVINRTGNRGETSIRTSKDVTVDSLLGVASHKFNIEPTGSLGLYSPDGRYLTGGTMLKKCVANGDQLYLQNKRKGDEWLFATNWMHIGFALLAISIIGIILVSCLFSLTGGKAPFVFGVVIDAGSSHSSAFVYRWDGEKHHGTGMVKEVVEQKTGAIGKLTPMEAKATILELLHMASANITDELNNTSVYLGATAGMRLLQMSDNTTAYNIMLGTESAVRESGFKYGFDQILDGVDEGVAAWLSVNYLMENLPKDLRGDKHETIGALDCGGASMQIAFEVKDGKDAERQLNLFGNPYNVFSKTFMCYGMDQAYYRYLMLLFLHHDAFNKTEMFDDITSPCHNKGALEYVLLKNVVSPCTTNKDLPDDLSKLLTKNITMHGSGDPELCNEFIAHELNFQNCTDEGYKSCFETLSVDLPKSNFLAFSGFYFAIHETKYKGTSLTGLLKAANDYCEIPYDKWISEYFNNKTDRSHQGCFKVNFVATVFEKKFGFTNETYPNLSLNLTANDFSIGWSLGYMINATSAIPESPPKGPVITVVPFVLLLVLFVATLFASIGAFALHRKADSNKLHGLISASSISA